VPEGRRATRSLRQSRRQRSAGTSIATLPTKRAMGKLTHGAEHFEGLNSKKANKYEIGQEYF
jgi:hypothetical protein